MHGVNDVCRVGGFDSHLLRAICSSVSLLRCEHAQLVTSPRCFLMYIMTS